MLSTELMEVFSWGCDRELRLLLYLFLILCFFCCCPYTKIKYNCMRCYLLQFFFFQFTVQFAYNFLSLLINFKNFFFSILFDFNLLYFFYCCCTDLIIHHFNICFILFSYGSLYVDFNFIKCVSVLLCSVVLVVVCIFKC